MRLLVTRPAAEAETLAEQLRVLGHAPLVCPLLTVRQLPGVTVDLNGVQAILLTSAAGARAFAGARPERNLPVIAVGDATADVARGLRFMNVQSAAGDGAALVDHVRGNLDPARGALLHPSGADVADIGGALACAGFAYRRVVLYQAAPATALPPQAAAAVRAGAFDGVLFFSPRTAHTFVRLLQGAGLTGRCRDAEAYCLSAAVAGEAAPLPWRTVHTAPAPNQPALLSLLPAART
jgi:uroporphyrinogen-III synthase